MIEYACLGRIEGTKDVEGGKVGVVEGYIASWKVEDGPYPDRFVRGAFAGAIEEHKRRANRPVRLLRQHDRTKLIGGFPIASVREDAKGLWGAAEINLELAEGRDAYALAKQGVLRDFSVGFRAVGYKFEKDEQGREVRVIDTAELYEGSLVDEPMNRHAVVTAVKAAGYVGLPAAEPGAKWDAAAARERVLDMRLRDGDPSQAFLDVDRKFQVADLVDGRLVVFREAVVEAAAAIKALGSSAPADLVRHAERYLDRLGVESPFDPGDAGRLSIEQVKLWTPRDMEAALSSGTPLSRSAIKYLTKHQGGLVGPGVAPEPDGMQFSAEFAQALRGLLEGVRRGAA